MRFFFFCICSADDRRKIHVLGSYFVVAKIIKSDMVLVSLTLFLLNDKVSFLLLNTNIREL